MHLRLWWDYGLRMMSPKLTRQSDNHYPDTSEPQQGEGTPSIPHILHSSISHIFNYNQRHLEILFF